MCSLRSQFNAPEFKNRLQRGSPFSTAAQESFNNEYYLITANHYNILYTSWDEHHAYGYRFSKDVKYFRHTKKSITNTIIAHGIFKGGFWRNDELLKGYHEVSSAMRRSISGTVRNWRSSSSFSLGTCKLCIKESEQGNTYSSNSKRLSASSLVKIQFPWPSN